MHVEKIDSISFVNFHMSVGSSGTAIEMSAKACSMGLVVIPVPTECSNVVARYQYGTQKCCGI